MATLMTPLRRVQRASWPPAGAALLAVLSGWIGAPGLGAQEVPDSSRAWKPDGVRLEAVEAALAARWGVVSESLVLEWGTPRGGVIPDIYQEVELVGHGRDGRWVVSFRGSDGPGASRSVLLRAGIRTPVSVAARSLERGDVISEEDMGTEMVTHWGPRPAAEDDCRPGWVAQRRIEAGERLSAPAVRPPVLVVSGRRVQALWSNGRISLTVLATAVGSGSLGDRVFVRTEEGTRLEGIVQGPGEVLVSSSWMESGR